MTDDDDDDDAAIALAVPKTYLVIANIAKRSNVRSLLLAAVAFGCHAVLIVGQVKNLPLEDDDGDGDDRAYPNSSRPDRADAAIAANRNPMPAPVLESAKAGRIQIRRFPKWKDCVEFLTSNGIRLVGVEIDERSSAVLDDGYFASSPLDRDTALVVGNEGSGLHPNYVEACDALVMLAQYGSGTASFNVSVAASMVLYRFHEEQERQWRMKRKWEAVNGVR